MKILARQGFDGSVIPPVLIFASLCAPLTTMAQIPPAATTPGGRVSDQFEKPELPQSEARAPVRIEKPRPGQQANTTPLAVRQIAVEGATALDPDEIRALTAPLENRTVTFADLSMLADSITALYAQRGYAFSFAFIPEQTPEGGVVRMRVVEGTVDAVTVEFRGDRLPVGRERVEKAIRSRFAPLVGTGRVRSRDLERAALLSNDLAGVRLSVVVQPSASVEGAATLTLLVDQKPLGAAVGADNRLRSEFGREEAYATAGVHSLLSVGDRAELSFRHSLRGVGLVYGSAAYDTPVGNGGLHLGAFFSSARTRARSGFLELLEYEGGEQSYRLDLRYPVLRSRAESLYLSAELGAVDTRSELFGTVVTRDKVRTVALGATYDWADGTGARSLAALRLVQGLSALGATAASNPLRGRAYGRPGATFATLRFYCDQPLGAGLRLRMDSDAQFLMGGEALPASSECSFGGPSLGRGYDAGAVSGDQCWRGGVELARPTPLRNLLAEPYAFVDGGLTRHSGRLEPGERRRSEATSMGLGLRLFSGFGLNAELQWARTARKLFPGDRAESRLFFAINLQR